jgi:hypothetical protein
MSPDATKKQPTTGISELQELELEYQIRLRAYELYEKRGREGPSNSIPTTPTPTCTMRVAILPPWVGMQKLSPR